MMIIIIYALAGVGIWLMLALGIGNFRVYRPIWLMFKGDYDSAIRRLEELLSGKRLTKRMRSVCLYNKALCSQRMGKLVECDTTLDQIRPDELDSNLAAAVCGIRGVNLLLCERDIEQASELLKRAYSHTRLSCYMPPLACCELHLGNTAESDRLIAAFLDESKEPKNISFGFGAFLVTDKVANRASSQFFLGLYFLKKLDAGHARKHFVAAAEATPPNIYSERARKSLQAI